MAIEAKFAQRDDPSTGYQSHLKGLSILLFGETKLHSVN